jgi:hypothetical protein
MVLKQSWMKLINFTTLVPSAAHSWMCPNWPQATLVDLMNGHLQTTSDELKARLSKNWSGDIAAFDAAYNHILTFSDALSDGIVKQFPGKFPVRSSS